jgi:hypothetical protein
MLAGALGQALEHSDWGLEACGGVGRSVGQVAGYSGYGYLRIQRGLTLGYMGRIDEARAEIELGLAHAEEMNDPVIEANGLGYAGVVACLSGELERGAALARRGLEKAHEMGETVWIWAACIYLSYVLLENRSWQAVAEVCEEADRRVEAAGFKQMIGVIIYHATAAAGLGQMARARELVKLAENQIATGQDPITPRDQLILLRTRYVLDGPAISGNPDADLDALFERARAMEHRPVVAAIAQDRAARARARGDREGWQRWLGEARELQRELDAEAWVREIGRELDEGWKEEGKG